MEKLDPFTPYLHGAGKELFLFFRTKVFAFL
jgi:hypothetical protein